MDPTARISSVTLQNIRGVKIKLPIVSGSITVDAFMRGYERASIIMFAPNEYRMWFYNNDNNEEDVAMTIKLV